jgi:hypothetical protein
MKLLFRDISGPAAAPPAAGELYLYPNSSGLQERTRDLAMLVVKQGLAALQQGAGPIATMVVRLDPTLDEMLAAAFAGELLAGRPLPAAAEAFAHYAALAREGLTPGSVSLEISMQGIFKAIRSQAGDDLTVPENGERFVADWARMVRYILPAAAAGQDPFTTSPFAEGSEFARERTFLAKDLGVFRQDVLRGEQWVVDIPEGPPKGRSLVLRQPKSLLYKHWARSEADSGIGQPYIFLAVTEEPGHWVFSTDPVQKLPIRSLAEALQKEEVAKNPAAVAAGSWFDGKPFGHTLVAAPHGGTKLPDREVLSIVRRWSHAQPLVRRFGWKAPAAVAAAVLLLGFAIRVSGILPPAHDLHKVVRRDDGSAQTTATNDIALPPGGDNYALLFATENYDQHSGGKNWAHLDNPHADIAAIGAVLQEEYGFKVTPYFDQSKHDIMKILRGLHDSKQYGRDSELLIFFAGHGYFDPGAKGGYVVARDSLYDASDPINRNESCVSLDALSEELNKIPCRHVFLVLDTCFGGTIDYGVAMGNKRGDDEEDPGISTDEYVAEIMEKKSRLFLASAGKESALDGAPGEHSPFAKELLTFLRKTTNNGVVTAGLLKSQVMWLKEERPKFGALPGDEGGDFIFRHKAQ